MVKQKVATCRDPPTDNPKGVHGNNVVVISPSDPVCKYTFDMSVETESGHNEAHEKCYKCTEECKVVPPVKEWQIKFEEVVEVENI